VVSGYAVNYLFGTAIKNSPPVLRGVGEFHKTHKYHKYAIKKFPSVGGIGDFYVNDLSVIDNKKIPHPF
jgi:hypothetical protein